MIDAWSLKMVEDGCAKLQKLPLLVKISHEFCMNFGMQRMRNCEIAKVE